MKRNSVILIIGILAIIAIVIAGCSSSPASTSSQPAPATATSSAPGNVSSPANTQIPAGTNSSSTSTATAPAGTNSASTASVPVAALGNVEVRVTDAPAKPNVTAVLVTVSSVEIHSVSANTTATAIATATLDDNSGWITMNLIGPNTFDLLQIKNLEQVLAASDLVPGTYTQTRMDVTKVSVTIDGKTQDAKLPSGKLKFVQPFDVVAGKATILVFDFDATNSVNVTGNGQVVFKPVIKLNVTKTPGKMQITNANFPNGEVGAAYNAVLAAIGGTLPYTWSISSGILPPGLALTSNAIGGTPTAAGDYTFTVKVEDISTPVKKTDTQTFTVNIAAAGALQITTTGLPDGTKNTAYTAPVVAVGGTGTYHWSISAGSLPTGLALNPTSGEITGTPTTNGNFKFTVEVTDSAGTPNTETQDLTIRIAGDASAV